jgi:hypothetical protein
MWVFVFFMGQFVLQDLQLLGVIGIMKYLKRNNMKNVHILPTDKPSRLFIAENDIEMFILSNKYELGNKLCQNQNIYITSDEEIKDGDFVLYTKGINIHYAKIIDDGDIELANIKDSGVLKVILTTDQDLIKDCIQSIPDEFLEWFVKNPSCESVEVEAKWFTYMEYKIIIPKEEPKQESVFENARLVLREHITTNKEQVARDLQEMREKSSSRDLPLKEAAENYYDIIAEKSSLYGRDEYIAYSQGVQDGVKFQQERMYSEEDMKQFAFECVANFLSNNDNKVEIKLVDVIIDRVNNQFEQFKKK